jgi:gamma-glutamyl-gamma-aminobutyrate hydrolase PuuD
VAEHRSRSRHPDARDLPRYSSVNVARGGTLYQHIRRIPASCARPPGEAGGARVHDIRLDADSLVADLCDTDPGWRCRATTTQVDREARRRRCVSPREPADGIVEALELDGSFVLAVQWHPEDIRGRRTPRNTFVRRARPQSRTCVSKDGLANYQQSGHYAWVRAAGL